MSAIHEYKQEGHPTEKLFLTEEEYHRTLRSVVKYCHDVVLVGPDGAFYLGHRRADKVEPGPWFIGGAVKPFTSLLDSLVRNVARETGVTFSKDRFTHIGTNRYWFNGHEGAGVPHDALCEIFMLSLTTDEIASIRLDPEEYGTPSLERFGRTEIESIANTFTQKIFLDLWNEKDSWIIPSV